MQPSTHAFRVPLNAIPSDYRTFAFTVSSAPGKSSPFVDSPLPSPSAGHRLPFPGVSFLSPPSAPTDLPALVKHNLPLTTWHVSVFSDCTFVSLSVIHTVLDGTGIGLLYKGINTELEGKEWDVPPMLEENPFTRRLKEVEAMEFTQEEKEKVPPIMFVSLSHPPSLVGTDDCQDRSPHWVSSPPWSNQIRLIASATFESLWHNAEESCIFVGQELLDDLIAQAKKEVEEKTDGNEYVSENDVVANWAYQSLYRYDPSPPTYFSASAAISLRALLSTPEASLQQYPHSWSLSSSHAAPY
jgi:hypothetical protein